MKRNSCWFRYLLLLIIPLFIIIYQRIIVKNIYCSDPDYAYILNGLNINMLKLPLYSDHPGVPLTLLAAIGIRLIYLFSGSSMDIQTDVLSNPAYYEVRLQFILFLLIIITAIFSGFYIYRKTKNVFLGIVIQMIPFLFSTSLVISTTSFMPDAMLIIILYLFFILIIQYVENIINNQNTAKEEWLFPILCGLALSVKIIVLPLLLLPVILLKMNIKKILRFSIIVVLSFIVFTLPIVKQYPHMLQWFLSLFTHSGIYGKGSATIINPETYFKNILFIISNNHLMTIMMILSLILLFFFYYLKRKGVFSVNSILYKLFIASIITQLLSILIVSKTFEGKSYYLIVTYTLTTLSFVISAIILIIYLKLSRLNIAIILTCFLVISIFANRKNYKDDFLSRSMTKNECIELQQFIDSNPNYVVITNNAFSFNKNYALLFGLAFSRVHEEKLMQLYPNVYFYNVIPGKYTNWYKEILPEQIFKNGKALLVDNYLNDEEKANFQNKGYTIKLLFSNRTKAVYELTWSSNNPQNNTNYKALIEDKIKLIYNDEKWLNTIREKAQKKGISLDSMVYLDAKWMIDTYGK